MACSWCAQLRAVADRLTIPRQVGLATAVIGLVMALGLAGGAGLMAYRQALAQVEAETARLALATSTRLTESLHSRYREIALLAGLEPLRPLWTGRPEALRPALEALLRTAPDYAWIGFAAADGSVRAATHGLLEGTSVTAQRWFRDGLKAPALVDVHAADLPARGLRAKPGPLRVVDLAFPVVDTDGAVVGVLGAHLDWQALVAQDTVSDPGIIIAAADGTMLAGADADVSAVAPERLALMRSTGRGTLRDDMGGAAVLTGFAAERAADGFPGLGWIVLARRPADAALAAAGDLAVAISALGLFMAAAAIALALVIARRIAAPIHRLAAAADRIGRDPAATMLPRLSGSREVLRLSHGLRSLLLRVGLAGEHGHDAETRAGDQGQHFAEDMRFLRRLTTTDPMTNLLNRRAFVTVAGDAMDYFKRYGRSIAILIVDIDRLRQVNEAHGEAAGDAVIRQVATLIEGTIRSTDKAARFSGEEFVILLREVEPAVAKSLAERMRELIAATPTEHDGRAIAVTASIGMTLALTGDRDVQDVLERADQALYMAKTTGRNRTFVMVARQAVPLGQVA
jgi:diguanylate cyclase (GGDEF)-like protein